MGTTSFPGDRARESGKHGVGPLGWVVEAVLVMDSLEADETAGDGPAGAVSYLYCN